MHFLPKKEFEHKQQPERNLELQIKNIYQYLSARLMHVKLAEFIYFNIHLVFHLIHLYSQFRFELIQFSVSIISSLVHKQN